MAVATKKYKLFKVCKELNVGLETLKSFLEEKGVKIKGPNTAFSEEIYFEILEKFAKEKEIADKILERKQKLDGITDEAEISEESPESSSKKPTYVEITEKSIEDGVEEITRKEEPKKVEKKPVAAKSKKEAIEIIPEEKEKEKEPEKVETKKDDGVIRRINIDEIHGQKNAIEKKEKKKEVKKELEEESKDKKKKTGVDRKKEKEDKRRKAFDMIRKEEKRNSRLSI